MVKTKKSQLKEEKVVEKTPEKKFKPTEWARMDGLDHHLFLYWEKELMTKQEYEKIKKKVTGGI